MFVQNTLRYLPVAELVVCAEPVDSTSKEKAANPDTEALAVDHTPLLYRQFAEDLAPGQAGPDHGGVAGGAEGRPHQLQGAEAREREILVPCSGYS